MRLCLSEPEAEVEGRTTGSDAYVDGPAPVVSSYSAVLDECHVWATRRRIRGWQPDRLRDLIKSLSALTTHGE